MTTITKKTKKKQTIKSILLQKDFIINSYSCFDMRVQNIVTANLRASLPSSKICKAILFLPARYGNNNFARPICFGLNIRS